MMDGVWDMGRLFCMLLLCAMLTPAQPAVRLQRDTQPVLFSLIFPQLIPAQWMPEKESGAQQL